jgi:cysteinyl-tRNA synthetase
VNVGGEKMSKSLGNFTTIRALLESGVSPMTLRLFVLQAHYRKPLDFTAEALAAAATGWKGLDAALGLGDRHGTALGWRPGSLADPIPAGATGVADLGVEAPELSARLQGFITAMDDDLNTSAALGEVFELARPLRALANRLRIGDPPTDADRALEPRWCLLRHLCGVLGLKAEGALAHGAAPGGTAGVGTEEDAGEAGPEEEEIAALVEQRKAAKTARDYAEADRIREELRRQGITLVDKPGGVTIWLRS